MRAFLTIIMLWLSPLLFAQRPSGLPYDNEPLNLFESVASVVFYIVLPLIIIVLYIIWRRRLKKERDQRNQEKN